METLAAQRQMFIDGCKEEGRSQEETNSLLERMGVLRRIIIAAVLLAMAGLGVLTLSGFSIGYGEALTLVAAVLYALHIVGLGAWSTAEAAMGMTIVQLAVTETARGTLSAG